jgi:hypothetical protein
MRIPFALFSRAAGKRVMEKNHFAKISVPRGHYRVAAGPDDT